MYLLKNPNRKTNKATSEPQALENSLQQGVAGLATLPAHTYALFNTQVVVDLNKQGFREDPASAGFFIMVMVNGE